MTESELMEALYAIRDAESLTEARDKVNDLIDERWG
jgi:hypothetical protein